MDCNHLVPVGSGVAGLWLVLSGWTPGWANGAHADDFEPLSPGRLYRMYDLQHNESKINIVLEQNDKKRLEIAVTGYVLVSGEAAMAGAGNEFLHNHKAGELFLGG